MRITLIALLTAALPFTVGCMDGVGSTTKHIQSCYNTADGSTVCVDTPEGAEVEPQDVDGDGVPDTFVCADDDLDDGSADGADDSSDDSADVADDDSTDDGDVGDDSSETEECGTAEDGDSDDDGVADSDDCDCVNAGA